MRMIGLRDITMAVTDERGLMRSISIRERKEVEIPDAYATTAKSVGYAKPLEDADQSEAVGGQR
jgi:hypothetical protein